MRTVTVRLLLGHGSRVVTRSGLRMLKPPRNYRFLLRIMLAFASCYLFYHVVLNHCTRLCFVCSDFSCVFPFLVLIYAISWPEFTSVHIEIHKPSRGRRMLDRKRRALEAMKFRGMTW